MRAAALAALVLAFTGVADAATRRGDVLYGTARADRINGLRGDDRIYGRGGDDRLRGGPGNDRIKGGPGADRIDCGRGRDVAIVDADDRRPRRCEKVVRPTAPAASPAQPAAVSDGFVQAHRGGPQRLGKPAFAEETMPAFRDAWSTHGAVLELDVKLSADRVPVVIHDDTLDRTTACTGRVDALTWEELRAQCPSDVVGIDPYETAKAAPGVPMARLSEVLAHAAAVGATVNVEIKNIPGEADFDPGSAYATTVVDEIKASRLPLSQVIIQSFWPANLDVAERLLPGVQTAFLTFTPDVGAEYAAGRGYEWWSPTWPVSADAVGRAHELGVKVVPWTIDTPDAVLAAREAGVDALITNDPTMARQALGR